MLAVPEQVVPSHVCPIEQRIHVKPVVLWVMVPSLLMVKSVVGVVGVAKVSEQNNRSSRVSKDLTGFKNLSGLVMR